MSRILCATELNDPEVWALTRELALATGLEVELAHALGEEGEADQVPPSMATAAEAMRHRLEARREQAEELLAGLTKDLADAGIRSRTHFLEGPPYLSIPARAAEIEAAVIVLGHRKHNRGGFPGSVAEKMLREAPCPVLIAPRRERASLGTRWVVGVDFSDCATAALRLAAALAPKVGAELKIAHVLGSGVAMDTEEWQGETLSSLHRLIQSEVGEVEMAVELAHGRPAHVLVEMAQKEHADLLVLGTHGYRGLLRLLGSTAEGVLKESPMPTLVVRTLGPAEEWIKAE